MSLNLLKLCVGADSIEDLESWIGERRRAAERAGRVYEQTHTTRMIPTRKAELLDGGSLYWVIKGEIRCRQALLDIRPFTDGEGIGRCHLVLDQRLVVTDPRPRGAFQGWRYITGKDAPPDLASLGDAGDMPEAMRTELRSLGLW